MSHDAPIKLKNAKGETIFEYPDETSMLVAPGGLAVPAFYEDFVVASSPLASAIPRFDVRTGGVDFFSERSAYVPPRRLERALREVGRRLRLAAKMLVSGETEEEYDPWDD